MTSSPERTETTRGNVVSVVAFLLVVAALVLLLFRQHLIATGLVGRVIQVAAVLLMLWARVTFGRRSFHAAAGATAGGLVTTGPYRFLRHPIYAAIIWFTWAGQIDAPTAVSLGAAAVVTAGLLLRMVLEERSLVTAYPEYADYCRRTKRVVPYVV